MAWATRRFLVSLAYVALFSISVLKLSEGSRLLNAASTSSDDENKQLIAHKSVASGDAAGNESGLRESELDITERLENGIQMALDYISWLLGKHKHQGQESAYDAASDSESDTRKGSNSGSDFSAAPDISYSYPYYPGPSPQPKKKELPITTGTIVSIKSAAAGKYCIVDADHESKPLKCDSDTAPTVSSGFLILGQEFATNKIYEGDSISIKTQSPNAVCHTNSTDPDLPVICDELNISDQTHFKARLAPGSKPEEMLLQIYPASIPLSQEALDSAKVSDKESESESEDEAKDEDEDDEDEDDEDEDEDEKEKEKEDEDEREDVDDKDEFKDENEEEEDNSSSVEKRHKKHKEVLCSASKSGLHAVRCVKQKTTSPWTVFEVAPSGYYMQ